MCTDDVPLLKILRKHIVQIGISTDLRLSTYVNATFLFYLFFSPCDPGCTQLWGSWGRISCDFRFGIVRVIGVIIVIGVIGVIGVIRMQILDQSAQLLQKINGLLFDADGPSDSLESDDCSEPATARQVSHERGSVLQSLSVSEI